MRTQKQILLSLTGASGVGKTTLQQMLETSGIAPIVLTVTTRAPRPGDRYRHVSLDEFDGLPLLWQKENYGNLYGVTSEDIEQALKETGVASISITLDKHAVLVDMYTDSDVQCVPVHLLSPGEEELRRRMRERGDSEELIKTRIQKDVEVDNWARRVKEQEVPDLTLVTHGSTEAVFNNILALIACER